MKRNGVVVSKRELNKMINEARLNELNYREKELVKNFRKILKSLADSDKELSLFCENYGINTDDDNYLILASYLYSIAASSDQKTVYLLSKKLDDNFVKTCSSNIVDSLQHKAWFDQSNKILNNLAFGNKFVACNLWKILTNENYKPIQGTQMPGQIKDGNSFNGTMYVGGNKIENECRYTPWSLLWILAGKQQTTLNEAAKNGAKAQIKNAKNKTKQNNNSSYTPSDNEIKNFIKKTGWNIDRNSYNLIYKTLKSSKLPREELNAVLKRFINNPNHYDISTLELIKYLKYDIYTEYGQQKEAAWEKARNEVDSYISDQKKGKNDDFEISFIDDEQQEEKNEAENDEIFSQNDQNQNNENTSKGLKLLDDSQIEEINNIIQKLKNVNDKVFKMTRSQKGDDSDWEKLDEEVKEILDDAFQKYIPYLGQATKSIFVYPPQLSYDDKNDYDALDQEGRKWDSGKIQNENDLEDAINKMAEEYGLGSKTGIGKFDWAKWLTGLGSSIGGALRR